jgi:hypothetical protein
MENKLYSLLLTFTPKEFKEYGDFISSPFFNKEKVYIAYYNILKTRFPRVSEESLPPEKVFECLYPGKKFNPSFYRKLHSGMLKLGVEFITIKGFRKSSNKDLHTLDELLVRNAEELYLKTRRDIGKKLEGSVHNIDYYFNKFKIFDSERKYRLARRIYKKDNSDEVLHNLTIYSVAHMLFHLIIVYNKRYLLSTENTPVRMFNMLIKYIESGSGGLKDITIINIFYNILKLLDTGEEKYYLRIKNIYFGDSSKISNSDLISIYTILTNYCNNKLLKGSTAYLNEYFEIGKHWIDNRLYLKTGQGLNEYPFMNMVTISLNLHKYDWAEDFINKHHTEVKVKDVSIPYSYCMALLHYYKGNYETALEHASRIPSKNLEYKQQINSLYLKIYFDKNDPEGFYFILDNYRHFIRNNTLAKLNKESALNYLKAAHKLFSHKQKTGKRNEYDIVSLRKTVEASGNIMSKQWLLEKADAILNS